MLVSIIVSNPFRLLAEPFEQKLHHIASEDDAVLAYGPWSIVVVGFRGS